MLACSKGQRNSYFPVFDTLHHTSIDCCRCFEGFVCLSVCECVSVWCWWWWGGFKPLEQCHPVDRALLCDYVLIRGAMGTQRDQEADFPSLLLLNFWSVSRPGARAPHTHTRASTGRHVRILPIPPPRGFLAEMIDESSSWCIDCMLLWNYIFAAGWALWGRQIGMTK